MSNEKALQNVIDLCEMLMKGKRNGEYADGYVDALKYVATFCRNLQNETKKDG